MDQPRIRAGDADRQQMVAQLGRHLGEGRLTVTEFDERAARAHRAVYLDELPPLVFDLPAEPRPARRAPSPRAWAPRATVAVLLVIILTWSALAVVHIAPPVLALLLLAVYFRHARWSRRW
jgi:anti-sigma factor RsiW